MIRVGWQWIFALTMNEYCSLDCTGRLAGVSANHRYSVWFEQELIGRHWTATTNWWTPPPPAPTPVKSDPKTRLHSTETEYLSRGARVGGPWHTGTRRDWCTICGLCGLVCHSLTFWVASPHSDQCRQADWCERVHDQCNCQLQGIIAITPPASSITSTARREANKSNKIIGQSPHATTHRQAGHICPRNRTAKQTCCCLHQNWCSIDWFGLLTQFRA